MKAILAILIFAATVTAQVTVSQSFLDDANAAFREVKVQREANEKLMKAIDASEIAIKALTFSNEQLREQNNDLRNLKCDVTSIFWVIKVKRCK